ncbi:TetR/AcrR family transcriptional regulator [Oryzibacter oryziterrae]|uniref:TetR/AcrR family transcriptional regulator n=1 Tax=Oryzibacter oryziterrae TaxID=2766474 RepID=UPI001F355F98|nr:TetR/AcrR family transcriptional regulator [Oryzibacter oryziterrae]
MEKSTSLQHYVRGPHRRGEIAKAARTLIVEKGYAALRTRDVAERVGISLSTMHFHVATKSDLVALVAETTMDAFLSLLPPAPSPDMPAQKQLRTEVQAYYDSLLEHGELAACYVQLTQAASDEPRIRPMLEAFEQGWSQRFADILHIGREQGVFRANVSPLPAALVITGALTAFGTRGPGKLEMFWPVFDEIERGLLAIDPKGKDT